MSLFSLLISLDATVFVLSSGLILVATICPKICSKSRLKSAKSPFPVDVLRSKTSLLKLPKNLGIRQFDKCDPAFYTKALLRATRGACNPNLEVVITYASHICSQH